MIAIELTDQANLIVDRIHERLHFDMPFCDTIPNRLNRSFLITRASREPEEEDNSESESDGSHEAVESGADDYVSQNETPVDSDDEILDDPANDMSNEENRVGGLKHYKANPRKNSSIQTMVCSIMHDTSAINIYMKNLS